MLNFKVTLRRLFALSFITIFVLSCSDESSEVTTPEMTDELRAQLEELGFDASDAVIKNVFDPLSGETSEKVITEGDIHLSMSEINDMLGSDFTTGVLGEQYRTRNLVGGIPRTIPIVGYTGSCCALTSKMQTALQWAVNNYNRLGGFGITFNLRYSSTFNNSDIVVYNNGSAGGGGSAGFPSGGEPFKRVQINAGTDAFDTNVVEHVITHEIGHCLGLRHTDYFNRSLSCGSGGNEGDGGVGAINIPGTPTGFDPNSIMLSCFNSGVDGEFGNFDVTALETLY